ncbi:MAG: SurA N-terminal domain-containing protein [Deltaproteobacteria bacterium]|nr:SurA N-terminal domain-containing protein [Deltaproteobacteria bacterium]MBW1793103.1 SurA N-terminal domain-containing protein [Deltaproteobacteria bacterium]MBW2330334.1 SurA N-terminal domain-containing protein [Deltaproteobacteria bacterium]
MKTRSIPIKLFGFLFILCCLVSGVVAGYAELADRIVAIVNDDVITLSELDEALEPYVRQVREAHYPPGAGREMLFKLRQDILNKMIDEKLTYQETERLHVSVDERDVDQHIEQIKSEHFLTEEELRKSLAAEGYTLEEYRERIKEQMLQVKLINIEVKSKIAVTEKDIRDYYEEHRKDYQGTQRYHLRTILIRVPPSADADQKKAALEEIESIVKDFKSGAAFDELAKQYSQDGTAVAGGDLGLFTLNELSAEFQETVRSMAEGQISPVLQTPKGYQILMLQEIKKIPGKTLKEARIEIHERLYRDLVEEKYKVWLKALRDRSYVKIIQ